MREKWREKRDRREGAGDEETDERGKVSVEMRRREWSRREEMKRGSERARGWKKKTGGGGGGGRGGGGGGGGGGEKKEEERRGEEARTRAPAETRRGRAGEGLKP